VKTYFLIFFTREIHSMLIRWLLSCLLPTTLICHQLVQRPTRILIRNMKYLRNAFIKDAPLAWKLVNYSFCTIFLFFKHPLTRSNKNMINMLYMIRGALHFVELIIKKFTKFNKMIDKSCIYQTCQFRLIYKSNKSSSLHIYRTYQVEVFWYPNVY
jgi:hypothetical protein